MLNLLNSLFNSQLAKNLINRWSGSGGALIILGYLAQEGIISADIPAKVNGVPAVQLLPYLAYVLGAYLISHMHLGSLFKLLYNRKLNKTTQQLALDKAKLEDAEIQKQIEEVNHANK